MLEKIPPKRIVPSAYGPLWFTYKLRHYVEIANGFEKIDDLAEILVDVDLFEECLGQSLGVKLVLFIRAFQHNPAFMSDSFSPYSRTLTIVLRESNLVIPGRGRNLASDRNLNHNFWVASGRKTT